MGMGCIENDDIKFNKLRQDKTRYSLLLKIHVQVIILKAKNLQLFFTVLLYACIIKYK